MESTKECSGCKRVFPRTKQYFYGRVPAKDGLHEKCKECEGHKFKVLDPEGYRTCRRCKKLLPETAEFFRRQTVGRGGLFPQCRVCMNEQDATYYREHPEKFKQYRAEHREQMAAYMREYYPRYYATDGGRKANRDAFHRYRQTDKGKIANRFGQQRRRATKAQLLVAFTPADWQTCLTAFENQCAYCGRTDQPLGQDHVISLTKGGTYTPDNIVPACAQCNTSKFNHEFVGWYSERPFFDLSRLQRIAKYLASKAPTEDIAS